MNDTLPETEEIYRKMLIQKTGEERIKMGCSMFRSAGIIAMSSLKNRGIKSSDIKKELFKRIYGDCFKSDTLQNILSFIK